MTTSPESPNQPATPFEAAIATITKRHEEALSTADNTARLLGYAVAANPTGDHSDIITRLELESAVAYAIQTDIGILGGYACGVFVVPKPN